MDAFVNSNRVVVFKSQKVTTDKLELLLEPGPVASLRLELMPHPQHGGKVSRGGRKDVLQFSAALKNKEGKETDLPIFFAEANFSDPRYDNNTIIPGVQGGWKL